ncbi:MAG TPA: cobalamin-binding protein [Steroidobacteraceae bacterium]
MRTVAALLLLFFWGACAAAAITVTDDTGARLTLPHPARIVSLAPGATEMLFAAGAGDRVIATVEFSDEPLAAKRVPRIGDATAVDIEKLIALRPDVVVVWPGGGNPAQIAQIERLGLPIYRQQVHTLAELPASLRRLGELTGTRDAAERNAKDLEKRLETLAQKYGKREPVNVLLQVWNRPIYTVGGSQLMTDALRLCGARNVFSDLQEQGPAVDVEAVIARDPDIIVAVAPPGTGQEWLDDWRRFKTMRAVRANALIAFEDPRLSRLGPSAIAGTEALCAVLEAAR